MNASADTRSHRELGAAANVMRVRAQALNLAAGALDKAFVEFVRALGGVPGRILTAGAGTSECVARHTAQLLSSSGTPSLFVTPEAFRDNASAWFFTPGDAVLVFSDDEDGYFLDLVAFAASRREIPLFIVTEREAVIPAGVHRVLTLPRGPISDDPFVFPLVRLALGDALALALMRHKGASVTDPREGETLGGGRFRRVSEIMRKGAELPLLKADDSLSQARTLLRKHAPCVVGVVKKDRLAGVISDADFRRMGSRVELDTPVSRAMRAPAATLREESSVAEALRLLRESGAPALFVLRGRQPVGQVGPYDCLKA